VAQPLTWNQIGPKGAPGPQGPKRRRRATRPQGRSCSRRRSPRSVHPHRERIPLQQQ